MKAPNDEIGRARPPAHMAPEAGRRAGPPELMAPAGHWPQLRAAIEAGADAVYFGLNHFSARAKVGFSLEELPEAVATLHARGVAGFVTFNTLVFDAELAEAERALYAIADAGADAIIVQDVGVARLARAVVPALAVHGSTQMSITSAQGVAFAAAHGVRRVVLGRELALDDLRRIAAATDVELETFVHGALCVSYSGQCFSSEAWGGRSANRGQCAQACRLAYDLIVDGAHKTLVDERYLLSPGDLMALAQVPELVAIGIDAFKIEGRYKDAAYVALTTDAYRRAIDAAWAAQVAGSEAPAPDPDTLRDLEGVYSRGLGPWFVAGTDHRTVVRGRAPRHRGLRLGTVVRVDGDAVVVAPAAAWSPRGRRSPTGGRACARPPRRRVARPNRATASCSTPPTAARRRCRSRGDACTRSRARRTAGAWPSAAATSTCAPSGRATRSGGATTPRSPHAPGVSPSPPNRCAPTRCRWR